MPVSCVADCTICSSVCVSFLLALWCRPALEGTPFIRVLFYRSNNDCALQILCQFRLLCALRRGCAAGRLLGSRVRITLNTDVRLLCCLCVLCRWTPVRRADRALIGVLQECVCVRACVRSRNLTEQAV
jgi:hypothetical protein